MRSRLRVDVNRDTGLRRATPSGAENRDFYHEILDDLSGRENSVVEISRFEINIEPDTGIDRCTVLHGGRETGGPHHSLSRVRDVDYGLLSNFRCGCNLEADYVFSHERAGTPIGNLGSGLLRLPLEYRPKTRVRERGSRGGGQLLGIRSYPSAHIHGAQYTACRL